MLKKLLALNLMAFRWKLSAKLETKGHKEYYVRIYDVIFFKVRQKLEGKLLRATNMVSYSCENYFRNFGQLPSLSNKV